MKLIGDEVLYTTVDEASACAIPLQLAATLAEYPTTPPVRAGLAGGDVLMRDGDVFRPVVNFAARAVTVRNPDAAQGHFDLDTYAQAVLEQRFVQAKGVPALDCPQRQATGLIEMPA